MRKEDYQTVISKIHYYSQYNTSDYELVIELSTTLRESGFDDSQLNFYLGRAYQELNKTDRAIEFYRNSISTNDEFSHWTKELSSNNLANIYFEIDSYNDCITICKYNIENVNNTLYKSNAAYLTAHCYYLKTFNLMKMSPAYIGQLFDCLQNAEENILKALEIQSENVDYLVLAGSIYKRGIELDGGYRVEAKRYLLKAAKLGDSQAIELLNQL
ncbi:hypothetical protein [Aequorivita sp. KMM 9714]|uniref:tetratricopeptide repeat protein n=1 Tax=Aequorivita sp. KMM 9714 TaxID=2707173 RepID=UPI0013EBD045|nr:hypothetical protein [Aequorivita sp. KMM 9714]NGX84877.1 hypothetical protein [Aequorivita sp. KMM 9714]